ncbi:hypothetical protein Plhal304r1_c009g0035991 [Plasmopara halstedii]
MAGVRVTNLLWGLSGQFVVRERGRRIIGIYQEHSTTSAISRNLEDVEPYKSALVEAVFYCILILCKFPFCYTILISWRLKEGFSFGVYNRRNI